MPSAFNIGLVSLCAFALADSSNAQCSASSKSHEAGIALGAVGDKAMTKDIIDTAVSAGSFKTLATALTAAGLVQPLKGEGPFTVFAPTDEAFAKLPKGTVEALLKPENKAKLAAILTYHVAKGNWNAEKVMKLSNAETLNGQRVDIRTKDGKVMLDNATVTSADIMCSNGVIHVIDTVLMPVSKNLAEVATEAGSFSTLIAAASAAGLVDALKGDGPLTVFAPTDEAFNKLGKDTVDMLLKPENKQKLADVLKYHIVAGRVYSDQAIKTGKAPTLQGKSVTIMTKNNQVMIDNATVTAADIEASNGVIHVIDTVIMPK